MHYWNSDLLNVFGIDWKHCAWYTSATIVFLPHLSTVLEVRNIEYTYTFKKWLFFHLQSIMWNSCLAPFLKFYFLFLVVVPHAYGGGISARKNKRNYLEMWGNYLQECNGDTCFVWLQNAIPQTSYSPKNTLFTGLIFLIYTVSQHEQGRHSRGTFVGLGPQVTLRSDWFLLWQ